MEEEVEELALRLPYPLSTTEMTESRVGLGAQVGLMGLMG